MIFKLGPKTISIPSARLPQLGLPYLRLLTAIHIPIPKMIRVGGFRAALMSLVLVAGGFGAAFALVMHGTSDVPTWPTPGAVYALPNINGQRLAPDETSPMEASQTLQINLASGVRLSNLTLNNLDLGKAGLTDCVAIQRTTNTTGWLYVDNWVMTNVSAPSLDFANVETANLVLSAYTDGHAMDATIDSTITDMNIISTRGSGVFTAQDSVVDRVIIEMHGDAIIGTLTMTDVACSVGGFNVDYVKAGAITMDATSKFGDGDGINTADFTINSTVKARTITDNLVDTPITVK